MMSSQQGSLELLNTPTAQQMLRSRNMAQLAYVWTDGTPRVVPIWFHWNGEAIVIGTPPTAPKIKALRHNPNVAITINSSDPWPYQVLLIRGKAEIDIVDGTAPEYAAAAQRYFGEEQGRAWVEQMGPLFTQMARLTIRPEWVGTMDFATRFPSAVEKAMAGVG
jgi:general stress protein 26